MNDGIVVKAVSKIKPWFDIFIPKPFYKNEDRSKRTGREAWENWTRVMYVKGVVVFIDGKRLPIKKMYDIMMKYELSTTITTPISV